MNPGDSETALSLSVLFEPIRWRGAVAEVETGCYLSMSTDVVRDMIQHRRIPYVQNGRRYLIDRLDLDRYIEKAKVGAAA
jgi:excisionase family DNA binding protein